MLSFLMQKMLVAAEKFSTNIAVVKSAADQNNQVLKNQKDRIWNQDPSQTHLKLSNHSVTVHKQKHKKKQISKIEKQRTWQQDPFQTNFQVFQQVNKSDLLLQGIWTYKHIKKAIISGRSLAEGDQLEGWKVLKINVESVDLIQLQTGQILRLEFLKKDNSDSKRKPGSRTK